MVESHMEQVKSVLEYVYSISCMAVATEVWISPASVYHILPTAWVNQGLCKVDLTHVQQWPKSQICCSCYHPSAALEKWKPLSHVVMPDESWIHLFNPQLKWQNAEFRT
jgi:hypothetical protein